MHLAIGLPALFRLGPPYLPASWVLIYQTLPDPLDWLWPGLYVATGLFGLWGARSLLGVRVGFCLSALIHFTWGAVSFYGTAINAGGTIYGSLTYWYTAG